MKKFTLKKIIILVLCYIIAAGFQTLSLRADIGVCAVWDTISLNVYQICGIKVGYVSIMGNTFCVLLQYLLLRKEFTADRLLQIPMGVLFGVAVNFFYYDLFIFEPANYFIRVLLCVISYLGLAVFVGMSTYMDLIPTPPEAFCNALEKKKGIPFGKSRMATDILCMAASVLLSLIFAKSLKVREGTAIGMLLLGPLMGVCMKFYGKHFPRLGPEEAKA